MLKVFLLCVFFGTGILYSQETKSTIEVKYLVTFLSDSTNVNSGQQELTSLLIGNEVSLFKSLQKAKYDSLTDAEVTRSVAEAKGGRAIINIGKYPPAKFKPETYKSGLNVTVYDELMKTVYSFPLEKQIVWEILEETKMIGGYRCNSAKASFNGRNYVAWFAKDLPFNEGPYVFKGLPGLILEVYDSQRFYVFTLAAVNRVSKSIVTPSAIETTYEKFSRARANFYNDPVGVFESATRLRIPANQRERVNAMHKSYNNHLY